MNPEDSQSIDCFAHSELDPDEHIVQMEMSEEQKPSGMRSSGGFGEHVQVAVFRGESQ